MSEDELRAIRQPTLMIYGTADRLGDRTLWERVIGTIRKGELAVEEGAGQVVWLDSPVGVARRVEAFLS